MGIIVTPEKTCSQCSETKPINHFGINRASKDGLQYNCKECVKEYRRRVYSPDYRANKNLKRKFGITLEDYDELAKQQDYRCAICGTDTPSRARFSVDHNHKTKEVRGLLCNSCNMGIGLLQDSPKVLASAIEYLIEKGYYGA